MKAFRGSIDFTFTAADQAEAEKLYDAIDTRVSLVTCLPTEGGSFGPLPDAEIVAKSPLDHKLATERAAA